MVDKYLTQPAIPEVVDAAAWDESPSTMDWLKQNRIHHVPGTGGKLFVQTEAGLVTCRSGDWVRVNADNNATVVAGADFDERHVLVPVKADVPEVVI